MDEKSLHTLEFPKVRERLAAQAAFSASKELALGLTPTGDLVEARRRQTETTEAERMLSVKADLSIGGARDVRPRAWAASRGAVLDPTDFLDIKGTLLAARTLRRWFEKSASMAPVLAGIAQRMEELPEIVEAVTRTLDERGEVLDSASAKLGGLRREARTVRERLETKLQRLVGDAKIAAMLQEPIVTQREGRYVVPLRSEFKGRIKGIVHDLSASGATLFVEPLAVVDLNNRLREVELEEKEEVRRILAELSGLVGGRVDSVIATVDALAQLDLAFAKARYAATLQATEPILRAAPSSQLPGTSEESRSSLVAHPMEDLPGNRRAPAAGTRERAAILNLTRARHPLLDPETVVAIDLRLDRETRALVLTGPNTGGKTVSLKTAGLMALMAASGLRLPVESGSELAVFDEVFADIGDEQSIEQSLSTFSSHVVQIIRILDRAGAGSLVLLDELGAGTDPQEGAALARAILDELLARGTTTLVATHYPELKTYAHATPGARNASVEFDLETLRPTYRLTIGLPGRSNALAIAGRLGLDEGLIERARSLLSSDDVRAEGLLEEIHRQRAAAEEAHAHAESERAEAEAARRRLAERLETIEEERRGVLNSAREKASRELEEVEAEVRAARRELAAAGRTVQDLDRLAEHVEQLAESRAEPVARQAHPETRTGPLRLGDRVQLPRLGSEGVVTEVGVQEVEVQIGRLRVRAKRDEVVGVGGGGAGVPPASAGNVAPMPAPAGLEIDLRGMTVEEALDELDRRLDGAVRSGVPFLRIVHGKGTGRLRQAIRESLKASPYVSGIDRVQEAEGGEGVTLIQLADF